MLRIFPVAFCFLLFAAVDLGCRRISVKQLSIADDIENILTF